MDLDDMLNQIQSIRSKNNESWMGILRLAFKYAPGIKGIDEENNRVRQTDQPTHEAIGGDG